ncbi:hypothetical protein [Synechococcus sp. Lug-A]|uniref:hypothetical protein n=1 Tax=Synechococcus sp. Lug-A TaxID=2823740 RepID=UPI0020CC2E39|nr:hypothetical protein [Synechococcus sp. Lug-A]
MRPTNPAARPPGCQRQQSPALPAALRFSSNGLVLDGSTVVLVSEGTPLRRCLVMALLLGPVRLGRYAGPDGGPPESATCEPDPLL